jgi:hypothetical protein
MPNPWFTEMQIVLQKQYVNKSFAYNSQEPKLNIKHEQTLQAHFKEYANGTLSRTPKKWKTMQTKYPQVEFSFRCIKTTNVPIVVILQFFKKNMN